MNDLSSEGVAWELEQQRLWAEHYKRGTDQPEPDIDPAAEVATIVEYLAIVAMACAFGIGMWQFLVWAV